VSSVGSFFSYKSIHLFVLHVTPISLSRRVIWRGRFLTTGLTREFFWTQWVYSRKTSFIPLNWSSNTRSLPDIKEGLQQDESSFTLRKVIKFGEVKRAAN